MVRRRHRSSRYGRRNPRNAPWGSTAAEYKHQGGNPRARRTGARSGASGVYLGTLDELVVEVGSRTRKVNTRGLHLAWVPSTRNFALVRPSRAKPGSLDDATVDIHKQFHNGAPSKCVAFDWPERSGELQQVGLIRSLTYIVPPKVKSPQKQGVRWVHQFGDHGEEGHGKFRGEKRYADSLKPMLCQDARGNLFIKRRPGNKYTVTSWIYW